MRGCVFINYSVLLSSSNPAIQSSPPLIVPIPYSLILHAGHHPNPVVLEKYPPSNLGSLMAKWLEQAPQWHEMYCHDLKIMTSSPGLVKLGVRSTSVLSRTWSKITIGPMLICENVLFPHTFPWHITLLKILICYPDKWKGVCPSVIFSTVFPCVDASASIYLDLLSPRHLYKVGNNLK